MDTIVNPIAEFKGYIGCKLRPMDKSESGLFITLTTIPDDKAEGARAKVATDLQDSLAFQIVESRLATVGITPDPKLHIWLAGICDTPGEAVLWSFTIALRTKELGRTYTFRDWVDDFKTGLPTDEERLRVWDSQKGPGYPLGNAVDVMDWWPRPA